MDEVRKHLSNETWSVEEYLSDSDISPEDLPSEETVKKLLKLSGLPMRGNDFERIRSRLGKQLSFIDKLHRIPVEDEYEAVHESKARLMPRTVEPLSYEGLLRRIETQEKSADLGEADGSWDSTSLAKMKENSFFVVRGGLMQNRS